MKKTRILLMFLLGSSALSASGWELQLCLGPWTLEPWTSPVERQAERIVGEEAARLLAPLLSEFTIIAFEPRVDARSRGYALGAACWRRLEDDRFAVGLSASYLDLSLPFSLEDERDIYFHEIHVASMKTSGEGRMDLRTFMLASQGRWRAFRSGRFAAYAGLGLSLLRFTGSLYLPLVARVQTILGTLELRETEEKTLAELRAEDADIPAWIVAPAVSASLHYRLWKGGRLFIEISLSQGTFVSAGLNVNL